ncbi:MAG TPA: EAL domain-containing protein [Woeseiaceae bacterium]|nr:EAL domain-containing protein [Woeseiaceae bacterium]
MAGHSILFIGRSRFTSAYLAELETLSFCTMLMRHGGVTIPANAPSAIDLVLFEAGSNPEPVADILHKSRAYPAVALTLRAEEQRGIAARNAGAQAYLCVDEAMPAEQQSLFDRAVQRFELQRRLSAVDGSVLSILRDINDGVIVVDRQGHILDVNPAARSLLGLEARWQPASDWEQAFCNLDASGRSLKNSCELPLVRARGGEKFSNHVGVWRAPNQPDTWLNVNGQGLFGPDGELLGGVVTFRDATPATRQAEAYRQHSRYDELTGLPNRGAFTQHLARAIGRGQRGERQLAVLFVNLDRFRAVNDTLGHDVGDAMLVEVAERLRRNLRIGDYAARWGGDGFVACLEDFSDSGNAAAAAQKLLLVLSDKYVLGQSEVFATPSVGIALSPESGTEAERLVKAAEVAMLEAKKRGGGRFLYYSATLNAKLAQREELEIGLRHALVRKEFVLHYQPRIDLASGRLIGLEALLRWQHPRFGLLAPARFLPILESSGLIHSAGEWIIDRACRQLATWQRQFEMPDLSVAVNLSPQQLLHQRLADCVANAIANCSLDPGCVEFEIGDGDVVRKRSAEIETLKQLRKLGVRISLDHFGVGDVSFESLDQGYIDSFVLDQSLLADILDNGSHRRIIRAAIAMARGLGIEVAAEGVETLSQLEFLRECDCDLAQGYLISRPMQPDKVAAVLRSEIAGRRLLSQGTAASA